ncbi:Flagellin protein FlaA [Pseudoalteromonas sp. JB197]|nr:Flagellin protein FlaA [Pseudoalteromonas sp. JB197]
MKNTSFGGTALLDKTLGKFGSVLTATNEVSFQVGSSAAETLEVDIADELDAVDDILNSATPATKFAASFTTVATAQDELAKVDKFIDAVGEARSSLGASMNRLEHTMTNVTNMKENTQAAASTLMDADFAAETSNMTKQQLLMNSGISVLSTANSTTQMIGSLLR